MAGRSFTAQGLGSWYSSLIKPPYTPPGSLIGTMWTIIFILSAISLILFINRGRSSRIFWLIIGCFVLNGIFNAAWSYLFFAIQLPGAAVIDALCILFTVVLLIILVKPYTLIGSLLLLPYFFWVCFATFLNFMIYRLNVV
jgi:tryptophan-rich sensory protein